MTGAQQWPVGIHCQSASGIVFDDVHLFNLGRGESYQGAGADSTSVGTGAVSAIMPRGMSRTRSPG